jgi:hypothetical protein
MIYVGNNKRRSATTHRLWRKGRRPLIPIILWCATSLNQADRVKGFLWFDTNSVPIAIDTGATRSLTDDRRDFVGPLQRSNTRINGIGGHQQGQWMGTVKWSIFDDDGLRHDLLIPNTVLVPKGALPFRLLSPQHFAQENIKSGVDKHARGTINITSGVDNWLSWGDLTYRVTAQLTQGSNLPMINTVADYNKFSAFVSRVQPPDEPQHMFAPHLIPADDEPTPTDTGRPTYAHLFDRNVPPPQPTHPTTEGAPTDASPNTEQQEPTSATIQQSPHPVCLL